MDLTSGYNKIAMSANDIEKTTFTSPVGLYLRIHFGLCNGPLHFWRLMHLCFINELFQISLVFDDIITFSGYFDDHLRCLDVVFER